MRTQIGLGTVSILGISLLASLSCSNTSPGRKSFVLGEEVQISTNQESILKCEPAVAITDKRIVVAWNDSFGGMKSGITPGVVVGWAVSQDRGKSFDFMGYLPAFEHKEAFMAADSWFQTDTRGNIYLNILNWRPEKSEMYLYILDRNGPLSWEKIATPVSVSIEDGKIDRPMMCLQEQSRLLISYTQASGHDRIKRMKLIASSDGGKTWGDPLTLSEETAKVRGGGVSVANFQNYVLAVWNEGEDIVAIDELWYAFSRDGGRTFDRSKLLHRMGNGKGISPEGYNIGQGLGPISMDLTPVSCTVSNANDGGFFFISCTEATESGSRILHFCFDPEKETISRAGSLPSSPDSVLKLMPASPPRFDYPAVMYYDRRNDANNETLTDLFLNIQMPDEVIEIKLNSIGSYWASTSGDKEYAPFQRNFGDYISLGACGNELYAVWTDGRDGRPRIYGRFIVLR